MMRYQQAYSASLQVISVADQMMGATEFEEIAVRITDSSAYAASTSVSRRPNRHGRSAGARSMGLKVGNLRTTSRVCCRAS